MSKPSSTSTERPSAPTEQEIAFMLLQKPTVLCQAGGRVLSDHAKECAKRWAYKQVTNGAHFVVCSGFIEGTICVRYCDATAFRASGGVGKRAQGFDVLEALVKIYYAVCDEERRA